MMVGCCLRRGERPPALTIGGKRDEIAEHTIGLAFEESRQENSISIKLHMAQSDVDDCGRCRELAQKRQLSEVAVARDQNAPGLNGERENVLIEHSWMPFPD